MPRLLRLRNRATLVALVVSVLAFGAVACAPRGTHQESWAQQMLAQVNAHRANVGVPPLGWCPALGRAAQGHSQFQASINTMTHTGGGPGTFGLGERVQGAGYRHWSSLAENVARTGVRGDVTGVMTNWMNSPGHRTNILSGNYAHFGAGAADGPSGTFWTQDFGRSGSC